jgi:hypothetical protein
VTGNPQKTNDVGEFRGSQLASICLGAVIICWLMIAAAGLAENPAEILQI